MKHISSRDNPHFKDLKRLCTSSRERRKTGLIVLDGVHLIEGYAQCHGPLQEIVLSERGYALAENASVLESTLASRGVSVLSDALFDEIATVETPSGIMAVAQRPRCERGLDFKIDAVLLDGVQDPGNLGSILRTAAAAGFRQVLLSTDCAQAWAPKTLRAGMGAHFLVDIHESADLSEFVRNYSGRVIMTTLENADNLYALDLSGPLAWVFGSEGQGVRPELAELIGVRAHIPMPGRANSLNVTAAVAICLFETVRQRSAARSDLGAH